MAYPRKFDLLPLEIVASIFFFCLDGPVLIPPPNNIPTASWTLSQVSSTWRSIARNEPYLWSSFAILFSDSWQQQQHRIECAQAVLALSRHAPLSVACSDTRLPSRWGHAATTTILLPHASRIRHLNLAFAATPMSMVLASLSGLTSLLTAKLNINSPSRDRMSLDLFSGSLQLRHIELTGSGFGVKFQTLTLPSTQIQYLNLKSSYVPIDQIIHILSHCPLIVSCTLTATHPSTRFQNLPDVQHILPHLRYLSFETLYPTFFQKFLHSIISPALEDLNLKFFDGGSEVQAQNELAPFIKRCGCVLTRLQLYIEQESVGSDKFQGIEASLEVVPELEELVISNQCQIPDRVFQRMTEGDLIPRLST